jgi:hypothetical protein
MGEQFRPINRATAIAKRRNLDEVDRAAPVQPPHQRDLAAT